MIKWFCDKTDTNCNEAGGIDWGYMSIPIAEGIEHGSVSVEQQALFGRQSATKVGNEVRENNIVSDVPSWKQAKENWTKEEKRKLWKCYLRSKPKKRGYRKRMHGIWKQEGMKGVREQQLCDQRKQIEEKQCLEEIKMETLK